MAVPLQATAGSGQTYVFEGGGALTLGADAFNNQVLLGSGTASVTDLGGNTIVGGAGPAAITGGAGAQTVVARGGPLTVNGGVGGGAYWGNGTGSVIRAGAGAQAVLNGGDGDRLISAGRAGDLFGVSPTGSVTMDGSGSSGNDVFFGAAGTGTLTFLCGSGDDVLGLGQGTNLVTLGSGHSTVFANTGSTAVSTITAGLGGADLVMGGAVVDLILNATAGVARTFNVFGLDPGSDTIRLRGYDASEEVTALAAQQTLGGSSVVTLSDRTTFVFVGLGQVDARVFA